jgi:hypothetical protein
MTNRLPKSMHAARRASGARRRALGSLALLWIAALRPASAAPPQEPPTAESVVQRAIDTAGGSKPIRWLRIEGMVSSPQGISRVQMLVQGAGPDKFRVTQQLPGGRSMETGSDGDLAWLRSPLDGSWRLLDRAGAATATVGVLPHRMVAAIFARFPNRALGPVESKDGVPCRHVDLRDAEGLEATAWVEESTGRLRVLQTAEAGPAGAATVMTIEAWTKAGGMEIPRRLSIRRGTELTTSDFTDISDAPIPAAQFAAPDEVVRLARGKSAAGPSRPASGAATGVSP